MPAQGEQPTGARAEGRRPKASEERTRGRAARELAVYGDLVAPRRWRGCRRRSGIHPLLPFTLRQGAQARDDFAQIMDELDFVKELLARLPTRSDQAFTPLRIMFGSAVLSATLVIGWIEAFWRHSL